ncbi:MAG: hypothetical protein KDA41_00730 [Planctomycetales bacterium]|nr:hypothetical protein [Planctomycetales bacterium]
MKISPLVLVAAIAAGLGWGDSVWAQGNTSVQLPQFNFNTVNTTVTAPDGGTVLLGGVKRASSGRVERGVPVLGKLPIAGRLFNNRGIGQDYSTGMTTVTPRIIILEEEEAKLGLGNFGSGAPTGGVLGATFGRDYGQPRFELSADDVRALELSQHVSQNAPPPAQAEVPAGPSPEEIRARNERAAEQRTSEAYQFFEKGQAAEAAGKANVAKIYYNMAARRATAELKEAVDARLAALNQQ